MSYYICSVSNILFIAFISSNVRLSISSERLLIECEEVGFVFNLCLSKFVRVISFWCIFSTSCAKESCGFNAVDL